MLVDQRDLSIIRLISLFGQLTAEQMHKLVFNELASRTSMKRALARLVEQRRLARIESRLVGGSRGGSGQYVYQLGAEGHKLCSETRYNPGRTVRPHSLAIADCYITAVECERRGELLIRGYSTEPDCHQTIGQYELKPDLYLELSRPGNPASIIRLLIEVDMGTQGQKQILAKFFRYWNASRFNDGSSWPDNQLVVFVAVDERRADELRWLLAKGHAEQRTLFRVHTHESYAALLAAH